MAFEQAGIEVQKTQEFGELKSAIERTFAGETLENFLKKMQSNNLQIREFEKALAGRFFESADSILAKSGKTAQQLYAALPVSDQALMREFYLERIEKVAPEIRAKYRKAYRYY